MCTNNPRPKLQHHTDVYSSTESRQYLAEAIKKGVIEVHLVKCVISGVAGAGKTCLELLLLGKKPPKVRRSTGCAEPIRAVSGTRIQFFDGGWKVVSEEDLEDMIAHSIPIFCDSLDEDIPAEQLEYLLQQQLSSDTTQDKATPTSQNQATPTPKGNTTPSTKDKTSSSPSEAPQQATTSVLNDLIKRMNKVALPEVSDSDSDTSDDGAKESEKLKDLSGSNWIHLIDSGGQPEFYDLLPIFIRHASSIVFVQRLCDSLKDHPVVEFYNDEGKLVGVRYRYPLTCEEILKCMVRTLHSHPTEGKHSNIMVAGTFRDKESECRETRAKKNKILFNLLHPHFPNDLVLYGAPRELIFPLNTKHPDEDDQKVAKLLREAIESSAPDPVKIPISWYLLELALRRLAAMLRRRVLSRNECLSIAQQLGFSESECDAALTHFDELNLCLYYPDVLPNVVFSDPQVPLDKASELVQHTYKLREPEQVRQPEKSLWQKFRDMFSKPKHSLNEVRQPLIVGVALESKWLRFRDQGIVRREFLEKFPRHYKNKLFTPDDLLRLFAHLLILAPLSPEEFFMPSLLQRLPSEELDTHRVPSPAASPLLVRFPHGWPRNGVFCCLVVFLINHCKWEAVLPDTGSPILMAKNCIKFRLPSCTATVTLIDSYAYFEIHIDAPPSVCCRNCPSIQATIFNGIDKAANTLHYNNSKPCAAFLCPHSNSSSQTSSNEPHAAITKDQEHWECTKENCYGELTKREKVWFGTRTETAGTNYI